MKPSNNAFTKDLTHLNPLLTNSTARVNDYVKTLKHGAFFKYVKGLSSNIKTLANICLQRQNNDQYLVLDKAGQKAFGLASEYDLLAVIVDISVYGSLLITAVDGMNL